MRKESKWIEIFCDGSCSGNPGPGGWGALLRYNSHEKLMHGWACHTTNNRMELLGALKALESIKKPARVWIYTDSQWLYYGAIGRNKRIKNRDLWELLDKEVSRHLAVEWSWVRGHAGHPDNEMADQLARRGTDIAYKYAAAHNPNRLLPPLAFKSQRKCCGDVGCIKNED